MAERLSTRWIILTAMWVFGALFLMVAPVIGLFEQVAGHYAGRAQLATCVLILWLANRRAVLARLADEIPEGDNWRAIHGSGD